MVHTAWSRQPTRGRSPRLGRTDLPSRPDSAHSGRGTLSTYLTSLCLSFPIYKQTSGSQVWVTLPPREHLVVSRDTSVQEWEATGTAPNIRQPQDSPTKQSCLGPQVSTSAEAERPCQGNCEKPVRLFTEMTQSPAWHFENTNSINVSCHHY